MFMKKYGRIFEKFELVSEDYFGRGEFYVISVVIC